MEQRIISPRTMRETARGIALTSIYDEMLSRRELSVTGAIDAAMAFDICQQLLQLERDDASAEVTLYVTSPGGSVSAGLAIVDAMRTIACPVRTVCLDTAASMGAIIFVSGDRREMFPHAELMIHDPLIQNAGVKPDAGGASSSRRSIAPHPSSRSSKTGGSRSCTTSPKRGTSTAYSSTGSCPGTSSPAERSTPPSTASCSAGNSPIPSPYASPDSITRRSTPLSSISGNGARRARETRSRCWSSIPACCMS